MLKRLSVENYALIDKLEIEFDAGLNIITGETGAGKSILLGALGLILGGRADVSALKDQGRSCVVEGEFDVSGYGLEEAFAALDLDYDDAVVVRRVIAPQGKSRVFVNDLPVSLADLKEITGALIDIHSQHQTLLLAESRFQTGITDSVAKHNGLLERYALAFAELRRAKTALTELIARAEADSRDREYLEFQLEQLVEARLQEGEQEELEATQRELTFAAEIGEALLQGAETINGAEENVVASLRNVEQAVARLGDKYSRSGEFSERLKGAIADLKDIYSELSSDGERIEADPARLERTNERLDTLYSLQQKHHVDDVAGLIALREEYTRRLDMITGLDAEIEKSRKLIDKLHAEATALADQISAGRRKAAPQVEKYVVDTLALLGMPNARLVVEITPSGELQPDGADRVRFLFSSNKGSEVQPVDRVASGGEMSRLMLALKSLVALNAKLATIIFDEIDTGVSGSVADRMGEIIVRLSERIQVINITHLPQVASKGDTHFLVYKEEKGGATQTLIRRLSPQERVAQIAAMLSGADVTAAAMAQAELLLKGRKG